MKNKFKTRAKRLISVIIAIVITITMMPTFPVFATTGTTTYSYDGYMVEYTVLNEWNNGQSVEIKITNTGEEPIYNWAFKYDTKGAINGIWNATILENQDNTYLIRNNGWNYEIAPKQSITFGYTLANDFSAPELFELYSKRVDVQDEYNASINVLETWGTGFNGEIVITNNSSDNSFEAWTLAFDSNFIIDNLWNGRVVESGDSHYVISGEVWTNSISSDSSMKIGFTASIDTGITPEITNSILSEVEIENLEINWEDMTDTDSDGLADVYEKNVYNTDSKKADSDGDQLPDGYEVMTSRTNPSQIDSDSNGITDDKEDADGDGLSNYEEYLLGTNPHVADTDEDYLTDGEEVNTYGTDPLNPDTDADSILDSDEIFLGLSPTESEDGDTPVKQSFSEDDLKINTYNNNFKISIELEASNNVKRFMKQGVSEYAGILSDNKSIVGTPIHIEYNAGTITSGTITFRLDNDFVKCDSHYYPELGLGIERYGVFIYDKAIATMVPLPCEYDEENNSIYVDAKYMGNLMLVDYESLMYDLGVQPEVKTYALPRSFSVMSADSEVAADGEDSTSGISPSNETEDFETASIEEIEEIINGEEDEELGVAEETKATFSLRSAEKVTLASGAMRQVDLVLVVDTTGSMGGQILTVQKNLSSLIEKLRKDGISLYVSVVDYRDITCDGINSTKVNNNTGEDFYNSIDDIVDIISGLYPDGGGDGPETAIDGLGKAYYLDYRNSAAKFAFLITDATYKNNNNYKISSMTEMAEMLKAKGIITSVVAESYTFPCYEGLTSFTGGKLIPLNSNFCDDMYEVIYSKTPESSVVIANNLVTGFFRDPLTYGGNCDTDGDTLSDSTEVDWDNVKKIYDDGSYELYTWKELCTKNWIFPSAYDDGIINPLFDTMCDIHVIPAFSNPFSSDTDKDYYPDNVDDEKLEFNPMYINDAAIDDTDFHNGSDIVAKESEKFTDGKLIIDNKEHTAKYSFTRSSNEFAHFTLTPDATSFYRLISNALYESYITVSYEKGVAFWKETVYVSPEKDGTYLLKQGEEYTIDMCGCSNSKFEFTVEQDNWVFAKNGGVAYSEWVNYNGILMYNYSELYLTDSVIHQIADTLEWDTCNSKNFNEDFIDVMENRFFIGNSDIERYKSNIKNASDWISVITTYAGVTLMFVPNTEVLGYVVTGIGGMSTTTSLLCVDTGSVKNTFRNSLKDATSGNNYNLCLTHFQHNTGGTPWVKDMRWSSWTNKYINKLCGDTEMTIEVDIYATDVSEIINHY